MDSFKILILVAAILALAIAERSREVKHNTKKKNVCKRDEDCHDVRGVLYAPKRCCNGTCVWGTPPVCPWETACRRDLDCAAGQCCDWQDRICKTTATCNDASDCLDGMCCSYHQGDVEPGLCGMEPTEYCPCKTNKDCGGTLSCKLVGLVGGNGAKECGNWAI